MRCFRGRTPEEQLAVYAAKQRNRRRKNPGAVRGYEKTYKSQPSVKAKISERCRIGYAKYSQELKAKVKERRDRLSAELVKIRVTKDEAVKEERRLRRLRDGKRGVSAQVQARGSKVWRLRDPIRMMAYRALKRENKEIRWADKTIDILANALRPAPARCPIFGVELVYGGAQGPNHENYASIDRIDPSGGYTTGNVAIISRRANTIKNNGSATDHDMIASWIREQENMPWR